MTIVACEGEVRELLGHTPAGYDVSWLTVQVSTCDPGRGWRVEPIGDARWDELVASSDRRQSAAVRRALELAL